LANLIDNRDSQVKAKGREQSNTKQRKKEGKRERWGPATCWGGKVRTKTSPLGETFKKRRKKDKKYRGVNLGLGERPCHILGCPIGKSKTEETGFLKRLGTLRRHGRKKPKGVLKR